MVLDLEEERFSKKKKKQNSLTGFMKLKNVVLRNICLC